MTEGITEMTAPTFGSLLDTDFYKLTMQQLAFLKHKDVQVELTFICRNKTVRLPDFINLGDLQRELDVISRLCFSAEEIAYLRDSEHTRGLFCESYLRFLETLQLPPARAEISADGASFNIRPAGAWPVVTLWETPIMNAVGRLYFLRRRARDKESETNVWLEGGKHFWEKIAILAKHPEIRFVDFGTRRRWSPHWQELALDLLKERVPQNLLGTSNVYLARKLGLRPMGTYAHELDMVYQGIYYNIDDQAGYLFSHGRLIDDWWNLYGERLAIALVDTYGSDYFYRYFSAEQARQWRGSREDSGDPIANGEKRIAFYQSLGIDPREKELLPSDGLELPRMIEISRHFAGRIKVAFGWGTSLMNDMGYEPISIVVKVTKANGHEVAKLSDNRAKATGDAKAAERVKRLAGYNATFEENCRY